MKKSKRAKPDGKWLAHLQQIAGARTAKKAEASRDNLALARERKQLRRLGLWPPAEGNSNP